jgi:hypothetical protein
VVRIADTLNLDRFLGSEGCVKGMNGRLDVTTAGVARDMEFDGGGNLLPL